MSYSDKQKSKPVFNTLLHSEKRLSDLAYCAVLPVIILDELHHGKLKEGGAMPRNFEEAYNVLKKLSRDKKKLGRWEGLVNQFVDNIRPLLDNFDAIPPQPPRPLLFEHRYQLQCKEQEHLEKSKEILDLCLSLIYKIKGLRLECRAELTDYLTTVNTLIAEQKGIRETLATQLATSSVVDESYVISASGMPTTVFAAKRRARVGQDRLQAVTQAEVAARESQGFEGYGSGAARSSVDAEIARMLLAEQTAKMHPQSHAAIAEQIQLEEGTFEWLSQYLTRFPQTIDLAFTVDDCYTLVLESEEAKVVYADKKNKKNNSWFKKQQQVPFFNKGPFLYDFANVHMMSARILAGFERLEDEFHLPLPPRVAADAQAPKISTMHRILNTLFQYNNPAIQSILTEHVRHTLTALPNSRARAARKPRPEKLSEKELMRRFSSNQKIYSAAYDFAGSAKVRGWLNTLNAFKHFKEGLANKVNHHVCDIREMLCRHLNSSGDSLDSWLYELLKPLLADGVEVTEKKTPVGKMNFISSVKALVEVLARLRDLATNIKSYSLPAERDTLENQKRLFQEFNQVVNAIKYGYFAATSQDIMAFKSETEPDLKADMTFTPAIKQIVASFSAEGDLPKALEALEQANSKVAPIHKINGFNEDCRKFYNINGVISEGITLAILEISGLAKDYLSQFKEHSK